MLIRFTNADLEQIDDAARQMAAYVAEHPESLPNRARDPYTAFRYGLRGEWAVSDALELERRGPVIGSDGGTDLIAPNGQSLAVRYRNRIDGALMVFESHPVRADVMILCVCAGIGTVRIVGAISTVRFYADAQRCDYGHGPTCSVEQEQLTPWESAAIRLHRAAGTGGGLGRWRR